MARTERQRATTDILSVCLIQKILCYLSYKEASRMRILSKTWQQAWLTLPNLEFRVEYMSRGAEIVDAIMERYRDDKIPIDKFEFSNCSGSNDSDLFFVRINTWLDMALQNGKCLRELVLRGDCNLMDVSLSSGVANCYSLRKLSLSHISLDENVLQTLLSSCPLIVYFNLDDCRGLGKIELLNLQKIKSISIKEVRNMHKLKSLELKYVRISDGSLENLISRSQSLKVLMIQKCPGIGNIDSSNLVSLDYIGDQIPELKMAIVQFHQVVYGKASCSGKVYKDNNEVGRKKCYGPKLIAEERAKEQVCTRWLYLQQCTMCGQERNLRVFQKSTSPTTVITKVITQEAILRTSQLPEIRLLSSVRDYHRGA
ncbi:hypothetical protein CQW23_28810 [Capsicum baccatum]|uniref:F-box domain-containing protein n=1 Tax=Capsicum baccatum TaxID=33114 RepID=A0A2G2VHN1_CAPBA|nr:hypothetical protein CQW23_28810 [Capsicum baccatum]